MSPKWRAVIKCMFVLVFILLVFLILHIISVATIPGILRSVIEEKRNSLNEKRGLTPDGKRIQPDVKRNAELQLTKISLYIYRSQHGRCPSKLSDLVSAGLIEDNYIIDPVTGKELEYQSDTSKCRVCTILSTGEKYCSEVPPPDSI